MGKPFFFGKIFDDAAAKLTDTIFNYDPDNLTTHAIIIGMTGSGKTGLGIALLEEAALQGIPAIIIDPKGDLGNLVLHFPDLAPSDFEYWLDPEAARRTGKDLPTMAQESATSWKSGLAQWGMGRDQLLALQNAVNYTVFTPGSTSGVPVNIMSSFEKPDIPWEDNIEILTEKISSMVTALLGLVGLTDLDPVRSREHILVSNIIQTAWSTGKFLDLNELILQIQNPPFERLGAFPINNFYPQKDRMDLAVQLNNFLASPSFQNWMAGEPLDVQALLYGAGGKPRHSIFYIAHLNDNERMFFVTMLLATVESWMRTQRGTSGLRALVYFDEIFGYLPPVANPPSHVLMLRMLKQARAFGVGLVFATQNPVDVDYKALSNMGTWIIGRLQTEQDKNRLMDGLQSAGGNVDIQQIDKMISGLQKRVFLMHSIYLPGPVLFQSRWALNFLAGPVMRTQIKALNLLAGVSTQSVSNARASTAGADGQQATSGEGKPAAPTNGSAVTTSTREMPVRGTEEYFLTTALNAANAAEAAGIASATPLAISGIVYHPAMLAQTEIRYAAPKYHLNSSQYVTVVVDKSTGSLVSFQDFTFHKVGSDSMQSQPQPQAQFRSLPGWLTDAANLKYLQKEFVDWAYGNASLQIQANEGLKIYASPEVSHADFLQRCTQAARDSLDAELAKLTAGFDDKITALTNKIELQQRAVNSHKGQLGSRRLDEAASAGSMILGMLGVTRKKSVSSTMSKSRLTQKSKDDLGIEQEKLKNMQDQLNVLQNDKNAAEQVTREKWQTIASMSTNIPLTPTRSNVLIDMFGVIWLPYYRLADSGKEIPAFNRAG